MRKFTKRDAKEFNKWRAFFQWFVVNFIYGFYYKVMYRLEVQGRENVPKDKKFIVAANHLSAADPFLTIFATRASFASSLILRPFLYTIRTNISVSCSVE